MAVSGFKDCGVGSDGPGGRSGVWVNKSCRWLLLLGWQLPRISLRRIMSSSSCLTRHHCSASILHQQHTPVHRHHLLHSVTYWVAAIIKSRASESTAPLTGRRLKIFTFAIFNPSIFGSARTSRKHLSDCRSRDPISNRCLKLWYLLDLWLQCNWLECASNRICTGCFTTEKYEILKISVQLNIQYTSIVMLFSSQVNQVTEPAIASLPVGQCQIILPKKDKGSGFI